MDYVKWAKVAIEKAEKKISKVNKDVLLVEGMSSTKSRHLLNNLCAFPEVVYFEIGSWKGSTIIAASFKNKGHFYALDSFKKRFKQKENPSVTFYSNKDKFSNYCNYTFFENNSWEFDLSNIKEKVNVYFYDGDHSPEGTEKAFTYYDEILADTFILLMDDWNRTHIRKATKKALSKCEILFEKEFFTPKGKNDPHGEGGLGSMIGRSVDTWWNGLYLAVINKVHYAKSK